MRIGIDFRIADGKPCGMARYTTNLIQALGRADRQNEYFLFTHCASNRETLGLPDNFRWVQTPLRLFSVREQLQLPALLRRYELNLYHSFSFSLPLLRKTRSIMTVYDLIHLIYPQEDSAKVAFYYRTVVSLCARGVDGVVTISENSKQDIERALGVPSEKIRTVYGASDPVFRPMERTQAQAVARRLGVPGPFLLYVGNMRMHKNIGALIDALNLLKETYPDLALVICGEKNHSYRELTRSIRERSLQDRVYFLDALSDEDLRGLYCACETLVLPSFYEGFGLPPLEAMSCGTPVIVANTSALKEVAGQGALTFDPCNARELGIHLQRILSDESFKQDLIARGFARAKEFSWQRAAQCLMDMYDQVAVGRIFCVRKPVQVDSPAAKNRLSELAAADLSGLLPGSVKRLSFHDKAHPPAISVVIPTLDGNREGNVGALLQDLANQSHDSFEVLLVKAVRPQGKAINGGADMAKGSMLVIIDDDSRVPQPHTLKNLCRAFEDGEKIGMAGASVVISPESNRFQQRAARQFPRFNMPIVDAVTESDMASHGCCAIPRDLFYAIGKEKENIVRGLDPDLRQRIRHAGYKTVLVPKTWVYHPLSPTLGRLLKQFFRNGMGSAQAWITEPKAVFQTHEKAKMDGFVPRRNLGYRMARFPLRLLHALVTFRVIRAVAYTSYALGFICGLFRYAFRREALT